MPQHRALRVLPALLLAAGLCGLFSPGEVQAQRARDEPRKEQRSGEQGPGKRESTAPARMSAGEAAAIARSRYGGKVLKVTPQGNAYRIRLLQESGRVITVTIRD
jgi:hypothetical protein